MAIFGKSKKKQTTSPHQQLPPVYNSQPSLQELYGNGPQGNGPQIGSHYVNQRPSTSHADGLPPPQGWGASPPPYQPIFVTQNYILPSDSHQPSNSTGAMSRLNLGSMNNLLSAEVHDYVPGARTLNVGISASQRQLISTKLDAVITQIDGEIFSGDERELAVYEQPPMWQQERGYSAPKHIQGKSKGMVPVSSALVSTNYFAKVNLYANSRLPPNLPPMKLYIETFPLLCLAAEYSERVYNKPIGQERETHVDAKLGTKAMVIKSLPMDDMNTIVFAIRGTQTFMDWAVNLNTAPAFADGFLDDPGNKCHTGFLSVAKKMIKPVADRLKNLLKEDPGRSKCSLLITGHSAGGAVAALLYSHMLSTTKEAKSELNALTRRFKRVHCVTFGAPPVSLLPLARPDNPALRKSIFLSFVNEGDPVPRADKAYVRSLLDLYSTPAPGQSCLASVTPQKLQPLVSGGGKSSSSLTINKVRPTPKKSKSAPSPGQAPIWKVPVATLSNAGRIVLLRSVERYESRPNRKKQVQERMDEGVVAQMISDETLRNIVHGEAVGVVWGDPVCHMMKLYARRIQVLATNAVMGRG